MKSKPVRAALAAAALAIFAGVPQIAQSAAHSMHHSKKMGHAMKAKGNDSASSKAFRAASAKMHADMDVTYTGNADLDFVKGMMPHHQGAIEAAKIELQYGKDPETRKLAEDIVKAQETEIAFMREWMKKNAPK